MTRLADYQDRFPDIRFRREDGILEMAIHRNGGTALWGFSKGGIHEQLGDAFHAVGRDRENRVVILTGTGDVFLDSFDPADFENPEPWDAAFLDRIYKEGKDLLTNLLDIEVTVIGAVNGAAHIHAELLLLSDIVVAAEGATFADHAHAPGGVVPADGVHVIWPMLLGPNRARYFLLTGEVIDAAEAKRLNFVAEVVPRADLLPRAWELARLLAKKPTQMLRYSRVALTLDLKRRMLNDLGHGLLLEGAAIMGGTGW